MTISDYLMISAVLLGPIIAVQLTRHIDEIKEIKQRKLNIFKMLMSTRAYALSWDHVMTLNRIDLEFDKRIPKEKEVIEAWKAYLDLLNDSEMNPEHWATRRVDLLVELLYKMSLVLNYDFDKTHIKNSSYAPSIHSLTEDQQSQIRQGLIDILNGDKTVPMTITNWPSESN